MIVRILKRDKVRKCILNILKVMGFVVIIGLIVIGIPLFINKLFYYPIETSSTKDSDWLSFWGSFLGGIIGGIATLIGVIYTIKTSENNKKKEGAIIIPFKGNYLVNLEEGRINNYLPLIYKEFEESYPDYKENKLKEYIHLINFTKHQALDVKVSWEKPTNKELCSCVKGDKQIDFKEVNKLRDRKGEVGIPIILGADVKGSKYIRLFNEIKACILLMIKIYRDEKNTMSSCDIPIGTLGIESRNIHGYTHKDKFEIKMTIQCENYDITLDFIKK